MTPEIAAALRYNSPLHKKLEQALQERLRFSERKFSDRYKVMAKNEELFQAYIPTREVDRLRKAKRDRLGIPEYTTIELPYSYSVVMTAHTYFTSVFLARNPILQLLGRHGESEQQVQAMETLLAYQLGSISGNLLPLFVWLLDPGKYGYGVIGHHWDVESIRVTRYVEKQPEFFGIPIPGKKPVKQPVVEDQVGYEGSRAYNVRPQDFFSDPRVALAHFQRGEFCGRYCEIAWNEIFEGSRNGQYRYFNYEVLRKQKESAADYEQDSNAIHRDKGSGNVTVLPGYGNAPEGVNIPVGFIRGHEIYLKLIPKDWGLGSGDKQEIWGFNRSSNGVIFGGGPLGEYHGKFPFDLLTDEIDGYTVFPKSTLERCKPLNDVMTWLINTHFYNVRAAMNNQLVVDPSKVVMKDAESPDPGKLIRLKPSAYGTDIRTVLQQLQVMDMTKGHVADLALMMDMVQRMVPANDSLMGIQPSGSSRQTATSVRTSTHFSTSRLKTQCEWWSAMGFGPFTQKLIQRTQQNYTSEKEMRIVGDIAQFGTQFAMVTPDLIAGFYDYEPVDGTLPIDRFAQANLWQMIMGQMQKFPQVLMQYDIAKIFAWVARLGGINNLSQFRLTPDAALLQQAAAGNVVPIGTARKEIGGGAGPDMKTNVAEPQQSAMAGPTG